MNRDEVRAKIIEAGIVAVIRADSTRKAIAAAEALAEGGVSGMEVTLTVPGALDAIEHAARNLGHEVLVGAGTVLDARAAATCFDAGAEFLVTPGLDVETVNAANVADKVIIAGALTPTEVVAAWRAGADLIKIFPASAVGGASYIKALRGPLPHIPLVPTGGVNLKTAADFLRAGAAALGIGGELISTAALNSGDTARITELARQFLDIVRQVREEEAKLALASD